MLKKLKLEKTEKKILVDRIMQYFRDERDEEIGRLAAELVLEFICLNIAPFFYNKGIRDSIAYISERVEDMYSLEQI
jgi:uncharacterized protein (DUF2164 family)